MSRSPGLSTVQPATLSTARTRIQEIEAENPARAAGAAGMHGHVAHTDRFGLIGDLADDGFRRVIAVSAAGDDERRHRAPPQRTIRHARLTDRVTEMLSLQWELRRAVGSARAVLGRGIVFGHTTRSRC